jgi:Cu(I)/Ag(I) efflux system membrane protein CusA/SilA
MLVYLHEAMHELNEKIKDPNRTDIFNAIYKGAVLRLRPKLMTLICNT